MTRRNKKVMKTRAILAERFPLAFFPRHFTKKPLKVGIDRDAKARCPDLLFTDIARAIKDYVSGPKYWLAMVEGAVRVDLDGSPAGTVGDAAAAYAAKRLRDYPYPLPKMSQEELDAVEKGLKAMIPDDVLERWKSDV